MAGFPDEFQALMARDPGDWPNDRVRKSFADLIKKTEQVSAQITAAVEKEKQTGVVNALTDLRSHPLYVCGSIDDFVRACRAAARELRTPVRQFRVRDFYVRAYVMAAPNDELLRSAPWWHPPGRDRLIMVVKMTAGLCWKRIFQSEAFH